MLCKQFLHAFIATKLNKSRLIMGYKVTFIV